MIARVRGVIFSSIFAGSMLNVAGSMSTKTGVAPTRAIAPTVAKKVNGVVMTSSPALMPETISEMMSASDPLVTPTANRVPQ